MSHYYALFLAGFLILNGQASIIAWVSIVGAFHSEHNSTTWGSCSIDFSTNGSVSFLATDEA